MVFYKHNTINHHDTHARRSTKKYKPQRVELKMMIFTPKPQHMAKKLNSSLNVNILPRIFLWKAVHSVTNTSQLCNWNPMDNLHNSMTLALQGDYPTSNQLHYHLNLWFCKLFVCAEMITRADTFWPSSVVHRHLRTAPYKNHSRCQAGAADQLQGFQSSSHHSLCACHLHLRPLSLSQS